MKPRIFFRAGRWRCRGKANKGSGPTPVAAFTAWQSNMARDAAQKLGLGWMARIL